MFIVRLEEHIKKFNIDSFTVLFHGGEPLLFGKRRLLSFLLRLKYLEIRTQCKISFGMTTNGVSLDEEWIQILKGFEVSLTLSIDGPQEVNDYNRIDLRGRGTYHRVVKAIRLLHDNNIEPGILAVCVPDSDPLDLFKCFVDDLNIKRFDVLIPDANYENQVSSIENYYKRLIDLWSVQYLKEGVRIRIIHTMIQGLLGVDSHSHTVGYGPVTSLTILTDGSMEPVDVLRIAGHSATKTNMSIFTHGLQQITENEVWLDAYRSSLNLADECLKCRFRLACGGGSLPHRWSKKDGYNNPSVYCNDLKGMFNHLIPIFSSSLSYTSQVLAG